MDWEHLGKVCTQIADMWIFGISGILLMFVGYLSSTS